jgi:outer membrane immunogenic protein
MFMKMRLLSGVAMALLAAAGSAAAADLGIPFKAPVTSWTGCRVGIQGGLGVGQNTWTVTGETANTDISGGVVGGQVGCDMQFLGPWVAGIQGSMVTSDFTGTGFAWSPPPGNPNANLSLHSNIDWMAAVTGRLGFVVNNYLIYGRGGAAWTYDRLDIENAAVNLGAPQTTRMGWTAGGGIEWMFTPNWSAFLEVDYYGFGAPNVSFPGAPGVTAPFSVNTSLSLETFTLGVNYRF